MAQIGYWIIAVFLAAAGGVAYYYIPPTQQALPSRQVEKQEPATPPRTDAVVQSIPEFDIVRVEPSGELVVAGRATPNALIVLMRGETPHDSGSADAAGHFAMAPKALPPGTHELRLVATDRDGSRISQQSVFVSIPENKTGEAIVALQKPGGPTVNLNIAATRPKGERARVHIFAVDVLTTGVVAASGSAEPGAEIRLYLNDTFIAAAKAAENGQWSLTIEKGVTPGLYRLRADDTGSDGKVLSRAEIQFEVPTIQAVPQSGSAVAANNPSNVVVESVRTATVAKGDSLWRISQKIYGSGMRYTVIHGANSQQIRDPNLIFPGQVFVVPANQPGG